MDDDAFRYLVLALIAAAALAVYHMLHDHHVVSFYLARHDKRMYWLHKASYCIVWITMTTNLRAFALPALAGFMGAAA